MSEFLKHYLSSTPAQQQKLQVIAYLASLDHLSHVSPSISASIVQEIRDQRSHLKLIASENFSSLSVQLAMGNLLTDKYAEGYPYHRFYAGCDNIDSIEAKACNQLKELFQCEHAYVQPHSGADANLIAFWAILTRRVQNKELEELGKKSLDELSRDEYELIRITMLNQKLLGMGLNSGGHLTHGYKHNISSKMMQAISYEVDPKTEQLDYKTIENIAKKERPAILLAGYSAYPRKINFAKLREIADQVGATFMVDMAHFSGLVAGKVFTGEYDPIPYADVVTSTTHKTLRGPRGGIILCKKEFGEFIDKGCPLAMGGPLPHVMAAKSLAFQEASHPSFQLYAKQVVDNAACLANELMNLGVRITTGGTENHLLVADVTSFGLTGRQAELALREALITLNRNAIPYDLNGPWYTSGIRLGTPAMTTLGMKEPQMKEIASVIAKVLKHTEPSAAKEGGVSKAKSSTPAPILEEAKSRVTELLKDFPVYPELKID